jgi:hypothetical protein
MGMFRTPFLIRSLRRRVRAGLWPAVVGLLAATAPRVARGTTDDDQFREDTILCEEALAHLKTCCPGFVGSQIACNYYYSSFSDDGCDATAAELTLPSLDIAQSTCIDGMTCAALLASGVCASAESPGANCP